MARRDRTSSGKEEGVREPIRSRDEMQKVLEAFVRVSTGDEESLLRDPVDAIRQALDLWNRAEATAVRDHLLESPCPVIPVKGNTTFRLSAIGVSRYCSMYGVPLPRNLHGEEVVEEPFVPPPVPRPGLRVPPPPPSVVAGTPVSTIQATRGKPLTLQKLGLVKKHAKDPEIAALVAKTGTNDSKELRQILGAIAARKQVLDTPLPPAPVPEPPPAPKQKMMRALTLEQLGLTAKEVERDPVLAGLIAATATDSPYRRQKVRKVLIEYMARPHRKSRARDLLREVRSLNEVARASFFRSMVAMWLGDPE